MLFNSLQFFLFFFLVYALYLILNHKWQNKMLLLASYFFYGCWDWRFLSLIWISTVVDYFCGIKIEESSDDKKRRQFLFLSVFTNLSLLGFFKYFNFFTTSAQSLLNSIGISFNPSLMNIILPVGISFYTFQTMSYTIDIYYRKMKSTQHFFDFALFVAFFPQLVAGPIERAKHFLPQILKPRKVCFEHFYEGSYLIFWGLFLKVFVADNLAGIIEPVFAMRSSYVGADVLLAAYAFAFQIFADFAGYSSIARGVAKCMGFDLMLNFNLPYFSMSPSEFWQRWHISLSSWLRDYLYIPLGGNRGGTFFTYRNLALTMILGGLWHGANWTFICWGIYHGALLIIYRIFSKEMFKVPLFIKIIFFFHLTCIGWLIFRAPSIGQFFQMFRGLLFNFGTFNFSSFINKGFLYILPLLLIQIIQYATNDLMILRKANVFVRSCSYYILLVLIIIFGVTGGQEFIYFQF